MLSKLMAITLASLFTVSPPLLAGEELDHRTLTQVRNQQGKVVPLQTLQDWEQRREDIVQNMQKVMGPHPGSRTELPVKINVLSEIEQPTYRLQSITFNSGDKDLIPAFLYLPSDDNDNIKRAGIVALHPTGAAGKRIVDGSTPKKDRQYARELAERGFVVIAPDYLSFGDYQYDFASDDYSSGTMKGIVNHQRCLDLLQSLPQVDPARLGVIGHSLGGHNAIFLAVFDERVKVIVSSCGWTPFHDYYGGKLAGWTSDRYMPAIRDQFHLDPDQVPFDFPELVAMMAPRPFLSISPIHDSNFDVSGVRNGIQNAERIYQLHQAKDQLQLLTPDCEHDFPPPQREAAYQWIADALQ